MVQKWLKSQNFQNNINKMGADSSQSARQTLTQRTSENFLHIYEPICQTFDESLGKLKIFRKKQFNYDYVAVVDKLVEVQYVNQLRKLISIQDCIAKNVGRNKEKLRNYVHSQVTDAANLWVKVFACEVSKTGNNDSNYSHAKICLQYFNFNLKTYLNNHPQTPPPKTTYILSTILTCYYNIIHLLYHNPQLNPIPLITSITTPSLILIDIEGCLKFLPVPIFMLTDYVTDVDRCIVSCCRVGDGDGDGYFYRNVVMGRFGDRDGGVGFQQDMRMGRSVKMDKMFISRFKKLIKYMKSATTSTQASIKNSRQFQPKTESNSYIHLRMPSNNYKQDKKQEESWSELEALNTVQQYTKYFQSMPNKIQSLQFDKTPQIKNRHPVPIPKQPQKYKLKNHQLNLTIDSCNTNKNPTQNRRPSYLQQQQIRSHSVNMNMNMKGWGKGQGQGYQYGQGQGNGKNIHYL